MKRVLKSCLYIFLVLRLFSCDDSERFAKEFYKKKITNGKVLRKIDIRRGDFLVVYTESLKQDTVAIYGYHSLFNKIDSLTYLNKKENDYVIYFKDLVKENIRYSDTVGFFDYTKQSVSPQ
jgi:hypothetical protein